MTYMTKMRLTAVEFSSQSHFVYSYSTSPMVTFSVFSATTDWLPAAEATRMSTITRTADASIQV